MEEKSILITKDYTKIKDVVFTDPNLMADDAKEQIKNLYYSIRDIESQLHQARGKVRELDTTLQEKKKEYQRILPLFTLEFETKEKEYVTRKANVGIIGLGNDIIGRSSMT